MTDAHALQLPAVPTWRQRWFATFMSIAARRYNQVLGPRKHHLLRDLRGTVVEIGPGTGANFPYLPRGIDWIGVEPNPAMVPYLEQAASAREIEPHVKPCRICEIDLPSRSVDAVVSTLVLCSVHDLDRALLEVHRILRPGGRLMFLEHVAAPRGTVLRWLQRRLRPAWRCCADNCHPDREVAAAIDRAGFEIAELESFPGPLMVPVIRPHIIGTARRPA